jgi:beta-fructofuranosidase
MKDHSKQYAPYGKFLWNLWLIDRGAEHHLFHLQMERTTDPTRRDQVRTTIGHAVSKDFLDWQELSSALVPEPIGTAWDDYSLGAGSVILKDGIYYLYYTGKNSRPENANTQKICLATSTDLLLWTKHPTNPILEVDTRYYDASGIISKGGTIGAWRDPFVFKDSHSEKYFMVLSARSKELTTEHDACVALAQSEDMIHWEVLPPIFSPGKYSEISAPQIIFHKDTYYLFFTTRKKNYEPMFAKQHGAHEGLHCYYSKDLLSGYKPVNGNGVVFADDSEMYGVRVHHDSDDTFYGIGWLHQDTRGSFIGKVANPIKLKIANDQVFVVG